MITPHVLKQLLTLCAGIGSVLGISCCASLGIGISIGEEKMALEIIVLSGSHDSN